MAADQFFGWVDNQLEVERVCLSMGTYQFRQAAPKLVAAAPSVSALKDVLLWDFEKLILGRLLPAHRQTIGDCVSHGTGRGVQDSLLIHLAGKIHEESSVGSLVAADSEFLEVSTEAIYGFGRVEIGQRRLGRGDGLVGAWAADGIVKYGNLFRKAYGRVDLTNYSGDLAKDWGWNGVPDDMEPTARQYICKYTALCDTVDEFVAALEGLYPVAICSGQGFATTRDSNGFCRPSGSWAHCMEVRGLGTAKGNRPFAVIQQSWGNSPDGPNRVTLESGREIELPQGCFCADLEVIERMLRQRDSWAIGGPEGFEPRNAKVWDVWPTSA